VLTFDALALDYLERNAQKRKSSWKNDRATVEDKSTSLGLESRSL
jgi:hypothetical protein